MSKAMTERGRAQLIHRDAVSRLGAELWRDFFLVVAAAPHRFERGAIISDLVAGGYAFSLAAAAWRVAKYHRIVHYTSNGQVRGQLFEEVARLALKPSEENEKEGG